MSFKNKFITFFLVFSLFSISAQAAENYTLLIRTEPAGAVAEIVGPNINQKVQTPTSIILPKGEYSITITKEGYETVTGKILLDQNKQTKVTLVKKEVDTRFDLTVNSNEQNALIEISGDRIDTVKGKTPTTFKLPQGNYKIKVSKDGYTEFVTNVFLNSSRTITANIFPKQDTNRVRLTINTNISNAQITITGNNQAETKYIAPVSILLPIGIYTVTAVAPGYQSQTRQVALYGDKVEFFSLESISMKFNLSVTTNLSNSIIEIFARDGRSVFYGEGRCSIHLTIDEYTIKVSAPGYQPQTRQVMLNRDTQVNITLTRPSGKLIIEIPDNVLNTTIRSPLSLIKVLIDGKEHSGLVFDLPEGQHKISIISGGIKIDYDIYIQEGKVYTLRPYIDLTLSVE
ncbi:MAG: PEGA domain-containing protein [Spirochaetales bacterium]|nr:PEGA domain-containing protein [Spirochaetales bacterium]